MTPHFSELLHYLIAWKFGEPCPCKCGGTKVFPEKFPKSMQLAVEITCECGVPRVRKRHPDDFYHLQLCPKCARKDGLVQRTEFACIGWRFVETITRCRKQRELRPWEINVRQKEKDRNAKSRFDQNAHTYQCASCSNLERLWARRKEQILQWWKNRGPGVIEGWGTKKPGQQPPRLRTLEQLKKLMGPYTREKNPALIDAGRKNLTSMPRRSGYSAPGVTKAHMVRASRQSGLKTDRIGYCIVCEKIAMTTKTTPKFHKRCYDRWQREAGASSWPDRRSGQPVTAPRGAGRPMTEADLQAAYGWAKQFCLEGKSYREIAKESGKHFTTVEYHIKSFIGGLPELDLLGGRFKRKIKVLLEAARERLPSTRLSVHTSDLDLASA
jgi:hypothetical protein